MGFSVRPAGSATNQFFSPGNILDNRYRLTRLVHKNSWGSEVHEAADIQTSKTVIVKTMISQYDYLLRNERDALRACDSRHIVKLLGDGLSGGYPYLVMERVEGISLHKFIKAGRPSLLEALRIISEMCLGLAHAAEKGIFHKDIKPANTMIRTADRSAVLIDWEFSLFKNDGRNAVGTPHYMSPEQMRCENLDQRSDIYSLGITFFELISPRNPFQTDIYNSPAGAFSQEFFALLNEKSKKKSIPLPIISDDSQVQSLAQKLQNRMTASDKRERYQDYNELLKGIAEIKDLIRKSVYTR